MILPPHLPASCPANEKFAANWCAPFRVDRLHVLFIFFSPFCTTFLRVVAAPVADNSLCSSQELQEAMQMSRKTQSSLTVLMSVSAATNKWLSKAGESAGDSASPLTALMKDSSATGGKRESLIDSLAKRRNSVDTGLGNQSGASGHDGQQAAPGAPIVRNVDSGGKPQATANS